MIVTALSSSKALAATKYGIFSFPIMLYTLEKVLRILGIGEPCLRIFLTEIVW